VRAAAGLKPGSGIVAAFAPNPSNLQRVSRCGRFSRLRTKIDRDGRLKGATDKVCVRRLTLSRHVARPKPPLRAFHCMTVSLNFVGANDQGN
jgi:hypothetical protein